ncbi:ABC transporter permease [Microbacterium esteraromaticum]|uniref:ABC transporter permease n=1 Tax=Microbacterium esteraromaticum TaxID=57043 RepID=UPI0019D37070|nr:polyketide antibiotic transporter [Microbacterium esteraromaticum]MBN7794346.1 polyketide antibiotic transporter [Microbacterium esteraromaticum]
MRTLLLLRLRRDRLQVPLWVVGTTLLAAAAVGGVTASFTTEADRHGLLAAVMANPVILLFRGLPSGSGEAQVAVFLILPFLSMLVGMMSVFLAVRHTRTDEEQGRAELIAATPAARILPLAATTLHGLLVTTVIGVGIALAFITLGYPVAGSLIAGLAVASVGLCFLGVGLLSAQLMRTSRGANSLAVWLLVAAYLTAGLGNALGTPSDDLTRLESSPLTWLSPIGWAENTRAYADDVAWPALLGIALGALLASAAFLVQSTRDLGEGIVPQRHGRASASRMLGSPIGLTWRLSRGAAWGWATGGLIAGVLATSLTSAMNELARIDSVQQLLEAMSQQDDIEQSMVVVFYLIVGVLASCAAVQTVCRARQEEAHGTAEPVLAGAVDRTRWLASHLVVAAAAAGLTLAAAIAGSALGGLRGGAGLVADAVIAGAGQALAAAVILALTALVFVVAPRATIVFGWMLVLVALLIGLFGPLFSLPEWATRLSPFAQAPVPGPDEIDVNGGWWLLAITVLGAAAALRLMRRRELHPAS